MGWRAIEPNQRRLDARRHSLDVRPAQRPTCTVPPLHAVAETARDHLMHVVTVGERTTDEHREAFRKLGGPRRNSVQTYPLRKARQLSATHHLFVLVSQGEPAAMSPLESMALSLAVIGREPNGTACCVLHGRTGFAFPPGDARTWPPRSP